MNRRGFTLIEVLISVIIITAGVLIAFFIYRTGAQSFTRVREHNLISQACLSFLGTIDTADLFRKPGGEGTFGEVHYSWEARELAKGPVTVFKPHSVKVSGRASIFTVALFSVRVRFECGTSTEKMEFNQLSWTRND